MMVMNMMMAMRMVMLMMMMLMMMMVPGLMLAQGISTHSKMKSSEADSAESMETSPGQSDCVEQPATDASKERHYSFLVYTIGGRCVFQYAGKDLSLERLVQDFDEGYIDDVPKARTTESGEWLESYRLFWGDIELVDGKHLSD